MRPLGAADIARAEIDWQLLLMRPLSVSSRSINPIATSARAAASAQQRQHRRRHQLSSRLGISAPMRAGGGVVPADDNEQQRDRDLLHLLGKRMRSLADVAEALDAPRPPPEKRAKYCSRGSSSRLSAGAPKRSTAPEEKGGGSREREKAAPRRPPPSPPRPRLRSVMAEADAPNCALWKRLGGRNVPSWNYGDEP